MKGKYMKIKFGQGRMGNGNENREWYYGLLGESKNAEWHEVVDMNPSCKHDKCISCSVDIWKAQRSKDIYRIVRTWICRKCYATGKDALENVETPDTDDEIKEMYRKHSEGVRSGTIVSSEAEGYMFSEMEDK